MLFRSGWITEAQFEQAVLSAARLGQTPGYHLVRTGAIADEDLVDFFVRNFPLKFWPGFKLKNIPESTLSVLTPTLARHLRVLPILLAGQNLTLGLTDPGLTHVAEEAAYHTRLFINPVLVSDFQESDAGRGLTKLQTVVNVTQSGWGIDEWGLADVYPEEDDALPLYIPTLSDASGNGRSSVEFSSRPESERPSVFSIPLSSRSTTTLPPPPLTPSSSPSIRRSMSGMVLGSRPLQIAKFPAPKSSDGSAEPGKSTEEFAVPKSLRSSRVRPETPAPVGGKETPPKTVSDIMDAIYRAANRDEIIESALDFMLLFARRAAFLLVKKNEIRGYDIKGEETNLTAVKSYWIPADSESLFKKVATQRQIHLGPFGRSASDAVFSAALGGRPLRVLVIPVVLQNRVAGLLYADKLRIDMPPWNFLERIAEVTGASLYRLLMERKHSHV